MNATKDDRMYKMHRQTKIGKGDDEMTQDEMARDEIAEAAHNEIGVADDPLADAYDPDDELDFVHLKGTCKA